MIKKIPLAVLFIVALSLAVSVLMGFVWEGVCFLRNFGATEVITDKVQAVLTTRDFHNQFFNQVGAMLDLYNSSFPNNMRYGSGLGLIGGAIFSLLLIERIFPQAWSSRIFRFICGATSGAIIGARLDLVFNSDPLPFLLTTVAASVVLAIFLTLLKTSEQPHLKELWSESHV